MRSEASKNYTRCLMLTATAAIICKSLGANKRGKKHKILCNRLMPLGDALLRRVPFDGQKMVLSYLCSLSCVICTVTL